MKRVLVTGGAGFIGSNTVGGLLKRGFKVRVLDNFSTGKEENLAEYLHTIELMEGDIRNTETVSKAIKTMDYVVHLAALGSVPRSVDDPLTTHDTNATGTLNVLKASQEAKIQRVIYSSSSSVYGDSLILPKEETMSPNPKSPYAVSKLTGEYYCRVFYQMYGLETVCLRYFNIYGPKQDAHSHYAAVIPKFICTLRENKVPEIYGDGNQSRDFTFINDCVQANIRALLTPQAAGEIINIATGCQVSLNELYQILIHELAKSIEPKYSAARAGDVLHSLASIKKAQKIIHYQPAFPIEKGLVKTIQWFLS